MKQHKLKKGKFVTPLNNIPNLAEMSNDDSWAYGRLAEYIWIGLVLDYYGRDAGLRKMVEIINRLQVIAPEIVVPKISVILKLEGSMQRKVYNLICTIIDKKALTPLTVFLTHSYAPVFSDVFYSEEMGIEERVKVLTHAMSSFMWHQSNDATDIRFIILYSWILSGKMHLPIDLIKMIWRYPELPHDDEEMRMIRPMIASLFSDINTIDEFFEKCKSINEITDHMKCGIEGRPLLSSSDDITLPFAQRFKLARLETEKVMEPNQSDAFCFYTMVFGRIVQAMDVIMSCLEFECVPFIRDHVTLSYVLSLIDGITDTPELQMMRYKMCISNLVYQLCDKEALNQNGYESFLRVVGSTHFDDMLFSSLKERGVDENHFDFKVSKEAVVKCLEKLYIEMS